VNTIKNCKGSIKHEDVLVQISDRLIQKSLLHEAGYV
jgi:hypothetical protein